MERTVELGLMLAYYGDFLTKRQRDILSFRVDDDFSLGEIAEREGISRQAVYDLVQRAQTQLYEIEARLKLIKRTRETGEALARLDELIKNNGTKLQLLEETAVLRNIWEEEHGI